jgi:hypothetical protein
MKAPFHASRKLLIALSCYLILALIGTFMLEGILRAAVLCLFLILTIKTLIHARDDEDLP